MDVTWHAEVAIKFCPALPGYMLQACPLPSGYWPKLLMAILLGLRDQNLGSLEVIAIGITPLMRDGKLLLSFSSSYFTHIFCLSWYFSAKLPSHKFGIPSGEYSTLYQFLTGKLYPKARFSQKFL